MINNLLKKTKLWAIIVAAVNLQMALILLILLRALSGFFLLFGRGFALASFLMITLLTVFSIVLLIGANELNNRSAKAEKSRLQTARRIEAIRNHIVG